jgi:tetratricopeptide (TPR) repeat protein
LFVEEDLIEPLRWALASAIADYTSAIALNKKTHNGSNTYVERAVEYERIGERLKALADFDTAISIDPNNDIAYAARGVEYGKMGHMRRLSLIGLKPSSLSLAIDTPTLAAVMSSLLAIFRER